jgi:hypothetical protein
MKQKILIIATLLAFLSGCTQSVGYESSPTPLPPNYISTVVVLTGQAAFITASAQAPRPTETPPPPPADTPAPTTPAPTATPTFEPGFTEFAQIRFISPGPMSSLVSPIKLQALLTSGESQLVRIELLDESGRTLQRTLERVKRDPGGGLYRSFELSFEIRAVSERGYIRISSKDDRGRIQTLNTMPVLLYSVGDNQVNPPGNMIYERVMYEGLKDGSEVSGGVVNLKGRFWPFNDQPVFIELLPEDGAPISSRTLYFKGPTTQPFETTLPYKVTEPTKVRLSIHQDSPDFAPDPDLKKFIYVNTIELTLNP